MDIKEITDKVNLSTFFPGILIVTELLLLNVIELSSLPNEFFITLFLIVLSYSLGLITAILSRMVIDTLSELYPRYFFLRNFAHMKLLKAIEIYKTEYEQELEKNDLAEDKIGNRSKWNCVYRAALSRTCDHIDIKKRREQGRYIRNLLFPVILAAAFLIFDKCDSILRIGISIGLFLVILILYSYSELSNFAEANDIVKKNKNAS